MNRYKKAIAANGSQVRAGSIDIALRRTDPPMYVYEVLWQLAINEVALLWESDTASFVLHLVSARKTSLAIGDRYADEEWQDAFGEFLKRLSSTPVDSKDHQARLLKRRLESRNSAEHE